MAQNSVKNVVADKAWSRTLITFPQGQSEDISAMEKPLPLKPSLPKIIKCSIKRISQDNEDEDFGAYTTLPYLQASLFGCILEDIITQLRILDECNNELRIIKAFSDWKNLLWKKYAIDQPPSIDELEGIDPNNLGCNEYQINKLDFDRKYAADVITATYVDLSLNKSCKALEDFVYAILAKDEYRITISENETKNKMLDSLWKELSKQLRQQRNHNKSVIYDADIKIIDLKTVLEDSVMTFETQSRYTVSWQRARTEQHIQTIHSTEITHSETIEYNKQRIDYEQRVHTEVELLMNIAINEKLQMVEDWMNKYDSDMEAIDLKIHMKKFDYQNMLDKRLGLEQTIEKHDHLMKDWVHFKDEREKARLYREKMTNSAIIVQAWWRGLLVRKQLGPYKVAAKKKVVGEKKK